MRELIARLSARPLILAELLLASLFANFLALASPLFVMQVLNRYVAHGVDATLATLAFGTIAAIFLEFGFRQVRSRLADSLSARADRLLGEGAIALLAEAKSQAMDQLPPGFRREIIAGAETVQAAFSSSNIGALLDLPFALLFVIAVYLISPPLALISVAFLAAVGLLALGIQAGQKKLTRELQAISAQRNDLANIATGAADTVRAFNAAHWLKRRWAEEERSFDSLKRRLAVRQGASQGLIQGATGLLSVAIISVGAMLAVSGQLDIGAMMGANILAARALASVSRVAQMGETFAKAVQAIEFLRDLAKLPRERREGSALVEYQGGIEFHDLAYSHPGVATPLFESLSLTLAPGSIAVVTGGNGTGKTTFARVIAGLLEPTRGRILIDGVDLAQVQPEWWRRQLVYLPQEPKFLNATIKDNLLAANPSLDDSRINELIHAAGLRKFVDQSAKGFMTPLRNNGENLALGIRRRLALARALASDGALVIVDEPTEGLDGEGCAQVYAALNELARRRRTIIAFSHDPNIVKGARTVVDLNSKPVPRVLTASGAMTDSLGGSGA